MRDQFLHSELNEDLGDAAREKFASTYASSWSGF